MHTYNKHGASLVAQLVKKEVQVRFLGWEDPLEEGMGIHSSILAWRFPVDRGGWWGMGHEVTKNHS